MRRAWRLLKWIAALLVGVPVVLAGLVLAGLNTGAGQALAVRLVNDVAGSAVQISGLSGGFPGALRIAAIDLRDKDGTYAVIRNAALDWSPLRLLHHDVAIRRLSAAEVDVLRRPVSSGQASGSGGGVSLPVRVDLERLQVDRLVLAEPVAGVKATMALTGSAHLQSPQAGRAEVTLRRLDAPGAYHLAGRIDPATLAAQVSAEEPAHGFIAEVAKLPGLGALALHARLDGPWTGAATRVSLAAGPLRADAQGTIDLKGEAGDLTLTATAPAMAPRPDVSWHSVAVDAHVQGRFAAPQAKATVRIDGLRAAGAAIARLAADVTGNRGQAHLSATADGITVPGPKPDLLAAAPLSLTADVDLAAPSRPARFTLSHPLLALRGSAETAGTLRAKAHLDLPDLAALAAAAGQDVQGHAALDLTATEDGGAERATLDGTLAITGGRAPLPALVGPEGRIGLTAALHGSDITLSRLTLDGRTLTLAAHGGMAGGALSLDWQAALSDLSAVDAAVQGHLDGRGHVAGPTHDLAATATLTGEVATKGVPRGPLTVSLDAKGLPGAPSGHLTAQGDLDGAPLSLDAAAVRAADGTLQVTLSRASWKSAAAQADLTLPPHATLPRGRFSLRMTRLADLSRLLGEKLAGSVSATGDVSDAADGGGVAKLALQARDLAYAGRGSVGALRLDATVRNPDSAPDVTAALDVTGFRAGTLGGNARLTARGKQTALGMRLQATLRGLQGADLAAQGAATVDVPAKSVRLSALEAGWKGETLRLLGPARITAANGIAVDRLRLGLQQAVIEVAGRLSPTLDLTASLRNLTPAVAQAVMPTLRATGVVDAQARLTGSTARPHGTIRLTARGLHATTGAAAGLPPANLTADAKLAGTTAQVDARFTAGANHLTLAGTAPIDPKAAMRLRAAGSLDLATANPILTAQGERVRGRVVLDATVTGTEAAPRAAGTLRLSGGDVQDFANGAHVTDLSALVEAAGDTIRLTRLTGRAGKGTLGASGTVGLGGAMPVDLRFTAHRAQPLATDQLTATLDADVALRGEVKGQLAASGQVRIDSADIRIPDKLPTSIAVLDVRRPGQKPPPPPAPGPDIALDVTVVAPGQVFVRGRGLFAEVAGRIHVGGTAAKPVPTGVFRLRRGQFNLAGTTLVFTSGDVRFLGSGKLDPALHLVATSTTPTVTATLTVGGYASAPKITLSSTPPLPQDEILAQLLFHQSASSLSPAQLASAAAALAQISGVGGGALNPLEGLRERLGLDRLTVGGGENGTGPSLEAGRYVARGVYLGAKQSADGNGTQATMQVDLAKGLKLETDVGTGSQTSATGAMATQDPYGTSVGLTYTFRY